MHILNKHLDESIAMMRLLLLFTAIFAIMIHGEAMNIEKAEAGPGAPLVNNDYSKRKLFVH